MIPKKEFWERWSPAAIRDYLNTIPDVSHLRQLCLALAQQIELEDEMLEGMKEGTEMRIGDLERMLNK